MISALFLISLGSIIVCVTLPEYDGRMKPCSKSEKINQIDECFKKAKIDICKGKIDFLLLNERENPLNEDETAESVRDFTAFFNASEKSRRVIFLPDLPQSPNREILRNILHCCIQTDNFETTDSGPAVDIIKDILADKIYDVRFLCVLRCLQTKTEKENKELPAPQENFQIVWKKRENTINVLS
ncbi:hypothetical protein RF11_15890 [Thelohanellus kitauei]|uniref:Uncharacterized protein n=1 Tax=Thelohanellus kitauei TaxID=669202 RepID=A0A0C2JHB3_THEKT|nr:hypothetical protein RF11_15890 [Thelohanellus kitauei]